MAQLSFIYRDFANRLNFNSNENGVRIIYNLLLSNLFGKNPLPFLPLATLGAIRSIARQSVLLVRES